MPCWTWFSLKVIILSIYSFSNIKFEVLPMNLANFKEQDNFPAMLFDFDSIYCRGMKTINGTTINSNNNILVTMETNYKSRRIDGWI